MRRCLAAALLLLFMTQSSGVAMSASIPNGARETSIIGITLPVRPQNELSQWITVLQSTRLGALLTGREAQYEAAHASAGKFLHNVPPLFTRANLLQNQPLKRVVYPTGAVSGKPSANQGRFRGPLRRDLYPVAPQNKESSSFRAHTQSSSRATLSTGAPPANVTGINPFWRYETGPIAGAGSWMLNVGTGNLVIQGQDLDIPERGIDLAFRRTYNSLSAHTYTNDDGSVQSNYGDGWTNNFDAHLAFFNNGQTLSVYDSDGARYDYSCSSTDNSGQCIWSPPAGQQGTSLTSTDGGCSYWWVKKTGTGYWFWSPSYAPSCNTADYTSYNGRLAEIQARNHNNYIQLCYYWDGSTGCNGPNPSNALLNHILVSHSDGQALTLQFADFTSQAGVQRRLLGQITRPDGQVIRYWYDAVGPNSITSAVTLSDVCVPGTGSVVDNSPNASVICGDTTHTHHRYYANDGHFMYWADSPRWTASWGGQGSYASFQYASATHYANMIQYNGIMNFTPADGVNAVLQSGPSTSSYAFLTESLTWNSGETQLTDTDGHAENWYYDASGRVTEAQACSNSCTTSPTWLSAYSQWDANNNLTEKIDPRGNVTDYAYDSNGNTIAVALPSVSTNTGTFRPTSFYSYDTHNNLLSYCDAVKVGPGGYDWTNRPQSQSLCVVGTGATGATQYVWNESDSNEPYGFLTDTYTPLGYHSHFTYDTNSQSGGDYGLPTLVEGDGISQSIDATTPTRTPSQTFTYDPYGNIATYDKGNGAWHSQYDSMNRITSNTDPDGYTSYAYYFNNGQISKTETPYQHARGVGSTFSYDADGNETQETAYHGGAYASGASPTLPSLPPPTIKYYDGVDHLVEVQQPRGTSAEAYSNPWITRYLYDLSQNGTLSALPAVGGQTVVAYGNLYKTQELVPATDTVVTNGSTVTNGQFHDVKANAFDALGRPTARYFFAVNSSQNADALQQDTYTYDSTNAITPGGSNNTGLMSSDCNGLQQCTYFAYNNDSRIIQTQHTASSSLDRTFGYDADGKSTSIALPTWGTQYYSYDADGRLTQSIEPSNMDSYATLTYHYYADGKRSSIDVSSGKLTQSGLYNYAYRSDGKLEAQQINQPGNSLVGTTSLTFTYTNGGRETKRAEAGPGANSTPAQYYYDANYGYLTEMDYPAGKVTGLEYDPAGSALGWTAAAPNSYANSWTYQYSVRGEMLTFTQPGTGYPPQNIMANGVAVNTQFKSGTLNIASYSVTIDPRMGVLLRSSATDTGANKSDTGVMFDALGRITRDTSDSIPSCDTCRPTYNATARSYDQDGHELTTDIETCRATVGSSCTPGSTGNPTTYDWGVNNHPIRIGSNLGYETLHWDGDQLLFTTNANGLNDIKIGEIGDITPLDPNYKGVTFWDRDAAHSVAFCHNATGASGDGTPAWSHTNSYGQAFTTSPCKLKTGQAITLPTNMLWGSWGTGSSLRIGNGGIITMPRADGFNDGFNVINGVRAYDGTVAGWTTPDAYQGKADDPMSQKAYVWNRDNAVAFEDSSGYDAYGMETHSSVSNTPTGGNVAPDDGVSSGPALKTIANAIACSNPALPPCGSWTKQDVQTVNNASAYIAALDSLNRAAVIGGIGMIGGASIAAAGAMRSGMVPIGARVWRVFGGESNLWGGSWSLEDPMAVGVENYESVAGLPGGNTAEYMVQGTVINGIDTVTRGALVLQEGQVGGLGEMQLNPANASQQIQLNFFTFFK